MDQARQAAKPDDPRVKAALAEYMERVDRGEHVDREQFLAAHVDIADELGSFITTSEELARLASPARQDAEAQSISTRSLAGRDQETLIPQRVKGDVKETQALGLPEQFGRYKILKPLGSGAMGTVYLAEDTQLHRKVALKTPSFEQDETGELLERFYREARSAATIRHPHICPVFDVGEIGGKHYITMAYIEGRPLSAYIRPDKLQAERQTLVAIRKLALALQEAHDHNIIHRDLKPGNIMIDGKGEPIVMDFGLARKVHREDASRLTQSGMIVGSPAYMSPEQVEGDPDKLGPAADQYSLGVILYELLTGQLPFRGSVTGVIGAILTKEPTPVTELRPGIDARIAALCARMMKKSASERYPSMKAVAEAIAGILKEAPGEAMKETVRTVERATKPQAGAKVEKGAEAAAAVSITASNVTSLYEAAQKCMRKHDYEQVVQMLQQIPEQKRTDEVRALLAKARQLADEVAFLLAEIDEAERVNDNAVLTRATDELLKLKPKHHKALQIKDELSRYGKGKLWKPGGYTPDGRRIGEGSWIPWLGIAVGVIAFAATLWAVTIYLKAGDAVVRVQINNPDVKVSFQGRTLNIQNANKEFQVEPGENTLKITYGDSEFETDKFTLKDGENPAVVVELLDKTLAAKFGEESIGSWDVKQPQGSTDDDKRPQTVDNDGEWIDMIADYDVASISTDNQTWRDENGRLVGRMSEELEEGWVVYRSSSDIVGDYDLEVDFRGVDCSPVSIGLPLNDTSVNLSLGQWQWGLHWVDGRNSDQSVPPHKNPDLKYTPGELTCVQASVRHTGPNVQIETTVNGVSGGGFSGARSRLSIPSEFSPTPRRVKISSQFRSPGKDGRIEIHRARIRMVKSRPETVIPPATSSVPPDAVAFQGHSYKSFGEVLSWKEAKQRCEQMGGHLPIVETAAENAFLTQLAERGFGTALTGKEAVWLGATDESEEGDWRWIDPSGAPAWGTGAAYTNWFANQPNNKQAREHFATLWLSNRPERASGQWTDQPNVALANEQTVHFICEWDSLSTAAPQAGWTDLFNGTDLTGWTIHSAGADVRARNGILVASSAQNTGWIATEREFSDFELELEYKLAAGGNSGVFLRIPDNGAPVGADFLEVQLIDDAGQAIAHPNPWQRTGSVYGMAGPSQPVNAAADVWHKVLIRAEGPEVTVSLDGREINRVNVDTAPILGGGAFVHHKRPSGHIGLQLRRWQSEFRNIRIRELIPATPAAAENAGGWTDLFNGKDLTGWKGFIGDPVKRSQMSAADRAAAQAAADQQMRQHWRVVDGVLEFDGQGDSLCTERDYGDFELSLDWKIPPGGDSGIYLRGCPQIQIWDTGSGKPEPDKGSGGLYNNKSNPRLPTVKADNPVGQWNTFFIRMVGDRVTVDLNGRRVVDNVVMENFFAPGQPIYPSGPIELQKHTGRLWFRNIRIRELSPATPADAANAANAPRTAQPLPRNEWIPLDPSAPRVTSWNWGKPLKNPANKKWENGVLSLDNAAVAFNQVQAKDVSFRAKVRFLEGNNMALVVRGEHGKGGVYALFDKQNNGQMYVAFLNTNKSKVLSLKDDYFDFQVDAIGDQVSIQVNGQTVVRHRESQKLKAGHIEVTAYNARGMFKEMAVKILDEAPAAAAVPAQNDWTDLFNGRDLTGWRGLPGQWRWENGEVVGVTTGAANFNTVLCSNKKYRDFEAEFEIRLDGDVGNSGLQIRSQITDEGNLIATGPQVDVGGEFWGSLYGELSGGMMQQSDRAAVQRALRPGEYNRISVSCVGKHVRITLNGEQVVDGDFGSMPDEGILGWQLHRGKPMTVRIRNARIRELSQGGTTAGAGDSTALQPDRGPAASTVRWTQGWTNIPAENILNGGTLKNYELRYDPAALRDAGISLDRRISINVRNGTDADHLDAICNELGLLYRVDDKTITFWPKQGAAGNPAIQPRAGGGGAGAGAGGGLGAGGVNGGGRGGGNVQGGGAGGGGVAGGGFGGGGVRGGGFGGGGVNGGGFGGGGVRGGGFGGGGVTGGGSGGGRTAGGGGGGGAAAGGGFGGGNVAGGDNGGN